MLTTMIRISKRIITIPLETSSVIERSCKEGRTGNVEGLKDIWHEVVPLAVECTVQLYVVKVGSERLGKQPKFCNATTGFPTNWHLKTNTEIPYWWHVTINQISVVLLIGWGKFTTLVRSMTQICVVTHHQCGISALVSRMSFHEHVTGGITKCQLFYSWASSEN